MLKRKPTRLELKPEGREEDFALRSAPSRRINPLLVKPTTSCWSLARSSIADGNQNLTHASIELIYPHSNQHDTAATSPTNVPVVISTIRARYHIPGDIYGIQSTALGTRTQSDLLIHRSSQSLLMTQPATISAAISAGIKAAI